MKKCSSKVLPLPLETVCPFFSTLINEMLNCYLVTARCNLFVVAGTADTPPQNGAKPTTLPYPQYVGVDRKLTYHGIMTHRVLVSGDPVPYLLLHHSRHASSTRLYQLPMVLLILDYSQLCF